MSDGRENGVDRANGNASANGRNGCWNRIGIRGDRSCSDLVKHTHCRNCPVYETAALQRLDRALPAEQRDEWTRHFARPVAATSVRKESVLAFRIGMEWLALPTRVFREVAEQLEPHVLPYKRFASVVGIVNVRGDLIVHVSLAEMLRIDASERDECVARRVPRLLVVGRGTQKIAFTAHEVSGIYRYDIDSLRPAPSTLARSSNAFTLGILELDSKVIALLDEQRVLAALSSALS